MSININREDKTSDKRGQIQNEVVIEHRFQKLNQDLSILQSRTGIKKQQVSQKNLDQLISLLNKKIQQYSFPDTMIGQNHYKLVQKGMDAPYVERTLQEQRFLAEKELSSKSNQEKSLFWMDIVFSKEGIDNYLENNQNFVMFNAVDTMRSRNAKGDTFANRLLAKKAQLRGVLNDGYGSSVAALASNPGFRYDSFNRLEQESYQNMDIYLKAMNEFQAGNYRKYCEYLSQNSRDFKEVWQLLYKMVPTDGSNVFKVNKRLQRLRKSGQQTQSQTQSLQNNLNLQNAYHNGIQYLQVIYRRNSKQKKQNLQHIYDKYHYEQIPGFYDQNIPIWQEIYQLFRAGDYQTISNHCNQYQDYESIREFGEDLSNWLNNGERKNSNLSQKIKPTWDIFRYQIYLIMIKDPQCVDDIFIEDLDDCLWMNLKCSEVYTSVYQYGPNNHMDDDDKFEEDGIINNSSNSSGLYFNQQFREDENHFYQSILKGYNNTDFSQDDIQTNEDLYSWIDWTQLLDLRKMLYESFKESPEVFNPTRVLVLQLLTLDFIGFVQTLRQLEKSAISKHEFVHFLILISKTGLIRSSVECAARHAESSSNAAANDKDIIIQKCREFEEFAEKEIILYAKDRFDSYPYASLAYVETLPIKIEEQLQKYADIIVNSTQNISYLFKPNLDSTLNSVSSSSNSQNRNREFNQQIFKVNNHLKNIPYTPKPTQRNSAQVQSETLLTLLAKIVAATYISKKSLVEKAIEILDNVAANEEVGQVLKEQYRLVSQIQENAALKNQLKNQTDTPKLFETLEKYTEKYFGKKSKVTYKEEKKQRNDSHVINFYRKFYQIKNKYQNSEFNISSILQEMQEYQYISSGQKESAASEFYDSLHKEEKASYFDFLYLFCICCKKFFDSLKSPPSLYNQAHKAQRPEDIEKAKKIFKSVLKYSSDFKNKYEKDIEKEFEKSLQFALHQAKTASQF